MINNRLQESFDAFLINARAFNDKCSNTLVFLISQMKMIKRNEKLALNFAIELGRGVLSTVCTSRGEIMEPFRQFHAQKSETEITTSYLSIPSRLKKSPYKGRPNTVLSCLLPVSLLI